MSFGLKNTGATYQLLVHRLVARLIWKNMGVDVDDIIIKSYENATHTTNLKRH